MGSRKPFGIPSPPSRIYRDCFGVLVLDRVRHEADTNRWQVAMKVCQLIAHDRRNAATEQGEGRVKSMEPVWL